LHRRKSETASAEPSISAADLRRLLEQGEGITVLDVRQPAAYAEYPGSIPGSTRIPPAEIPDRYHEIPRDRPIVVYCT